MDGLTPPNVGWSCGTVPKVGLAGDPKEGAEDGLVEPMGALAGAKTDGEAGGCGGSGFDSGCT